MPSLLENPYRGIGLPLDVPRPVDNAHAVAALLAQCPAHGATPLTNAAAVAERAGVAEVWIKDERPRMGLGSFKALGAAFVIARDAAATGAGDLSTALQGRTYIAASAGNHGLSVAAGAALFGARAVIYLSDTVPDAFAQKLQAKGAEVIRAGRIYEDSMDAAMQTADAKGWTLLSDSTWEGYLDAALGVMEGYVQMASEITLAMPTPPTHVMLQAGVGGMACAVAAHIRAAWQDAPDIIVVEPQAAPALQASIRAGKMVTANGPVSAMGRLDCKTPSLVGLAALARDADAFVTLTEAEAHDATKELTDLGFATSPSGGAGLAAVLAGAAGFDATSRVLCILSEGPEDG